MYSPMPPAMSGIADYSAALVEALAPHAEVEINPAAPSGIPLYQIGNNPDHIDAYERALREPGVVVLHEANLHHLIAALTIKRGDWDAYLRELEFDGGADALAFGHLVRALETGPDYDGVPMLRRVLSAARGLIAHSDFVIGAARRAGFTGPAARIPHGAWMPDAARMTYRARLGLDASTPLVGVFGHLKPYKRIAESMRAFQRVVRNEPRARMILAGEPHPELPIEQLLGSLGLREFVRVLGRVDDIGEFTGYLAACDVVLNLRYPTVGETSGTLLRAFGLGKAVVVSDVGAFAEFPDEICLKVPPGRGEEALIADYLQLLAQRGDLSRAMGERARRWVERECTWDRAAAMYTAFLRSVERGEEWTPPAAVEPSPPPAQITVPADYVRSWGGGPHAVEYVETHLTRFQRTLDLTPPGGPEDSVLEMGAYLQITPSLKTRLGYGEVRGCYYGPAGTVERKSRESALGETFECEVDLFDAEKDRFPYDDGRFTTVLCCELLEHLPADPMFMMAEIHRVLKGGGHLVLTTPNIASLRAIAAILQGYHPGFFPAYLKPESASTDARHNREYTPREIYLLMNDAGFTVTHLETGPFRDIPKPELLWVDHLLERYSLARDLRGDGIYAVGRKTGPVRHRFPAWLYD